MSVALGTTSHLTKYVEYVILFFLYKVLTFVGDRFACTQGTLTESTLCF